MIYLTEFFASLRNLIPVRTYASDLEEYIESRCPQSPADVEIYAKEYNRKISQGGWL